METFGEKRAFWGAAILKMDRLICDLSVTLLSSKIDLGDVRATLVPRVHERRQRLDSLVSVGLMLCAVHGPFYAWTYARFQYLSMCSNPPKSIPRLTF